MKVTKLLYQLDVVLILMICMVYAALDILFDDNYGLQSKKVWNGICLAKSGSAVKLVKKLEEKMYQHAHDLEFEDAARVCDQIEKIRQRALIA